MSGIGEKNRQDKVEKSENNMLFNNISDKSSIDYLMHMFNGFHDSCIKEIRYVSGTYVDRNRAINPFDSIKTAAVIFQSQSAAIRTIEMKFEKVHRLILCPKGEDEDAIIYGASIKKYNGLLYWSSIDDAELTELESNEFTWISSEKISWTVLNDFEE